MNRTSHILQGKSKSSNHLPVGMQLSNLKVDSVMNADEKAKYTDHRFSPNRKPAGPPYALKQLDFHIDLK